jgi:membrane protease YdiL (CAAX protease family)
MFSALAYGLSWIWWAPLVWAHLNQITLAGPLPDILHEVGAGRAALGIFGPLIAAVIMRLVVTRESLKATLGLRRRWRYYIVAFVGTPLFVASIILIDYVTGLGRFVVSDGLASKVFAILTLGTVLAVPLTIGEEYGWRGYLLPRLLPLGEVRATLVLALIWATWHVPILLIGLNYPGQPLWAVLPVFGATIALGAFPFTWLYVESRRSVFVVSVMHSALSAAADTFTSPAYIPIGNPLLVSGGGLVGTTILLTMVAVGAAFRSSASKDTSMRVDAYKSAPSNTR